VSDPITPQTPLSQSAQLAITDIYVKDPGTPAQVVLDAMVNKTVELGPQALATQQTIANAVSRRDTDEELFMRYASARASVERCASASEAQQFATQLVALHRTLYPK